MSNDLSHLEPQSIPYEFFPSSTVTDEGIVELTADREKIYPVLKLNVPYLKRETQTLHLEILLPPGYDETDQKFPLMMFVQGSAWRKQNMGNHLVQLLAFARRGYVIAIVQYRSSDIAPFPAQVIDAKRALLFMWTHASEYHVDTERIAFWGDSSGANTAITAGLTLHQDKLVDVPVQAFDEIQLVGLIDFYGPMNLLTMNAQPSIQEHLTADSPEGEFIGGYDIQNHQQLATQTSPLQYVTADQVIPPVLIIHGDKDRIVPFAQSVELYQKLKACDKTAKMYRLKNADHSDEAFYKADIYDLVERFLNTKS